MHSFSRPKSSSLSVAAVTLSTLAAHPISNFDLNLNYSDRQSFPKGLPGLPLIEHRSALPLPTPTKRTSQQLFETLTISEGGALPSNASAQAGAQYTGSQIVGRIKGLSAPDMVRAVQNLTPEELSLLSPEDRRQLADAAYNVDPAILHLKNLVLDSPIAVLDAKIAENGPLLFQGVLDKVPVSVFFRKGDGESHIVVSENLGLPISAVVGPSPDREGYAFRLENDGGQLVFNGELYMSTHGLVLAFRWWHNRALYILETWEGKALDREPPSIMPEIKRILFPKPQP